MGGQLLVLVVTVVIIVMYVLSRPACSLALSEVAEPLTLGVSVNYLLLYITRKHKLIECRCTERKRLQTHGLLKARNQCRA